MLPNDSQITQGAASFTDLDRHVGVQNDDKALTVLPSPYMNGHDPWSTPADSATHWTYGRAEFGRVHVKCHAVGDATGFLQGAGPGDTNDFRLWSKPSWTDAKPATTVVADARPQMTRSATSLVSAAQSAWPQVISPTDSPTCSIGFSEMDDGFFSQTTANGLAIDSKPSDESFRGGRAVANNVLWNCQKGFGLIKVVNATVPLPNNAAPYNIMVHISGHVHINYVDDAPGVGQDRPYRTQIFMPLMREYPKLRMHHKKHPATGHLSVLHADGEHHKLEPGRTDARTSLSMGASSKLSVDATAHTEPIHPGLTDLQGPEVPSTVEKTTGNQQLDFLKDVSAEVPTSKPDIANALTQAKDIVVSTAKVAEHFSDLASFL